MPRPDGEMRNPFRNESDAFRVLVMIVVAAAAVIAAAELIGTWLGVILALVAISAGIYASIGWLRVGLGEADDPDPPASDPEISPPPPDGSGDGAPRS
jgi:hypothetical protein